MLKTPLGKYFLRPMSMIFRAYRFHGKKTTCLFSYSHSFRDIGNRDFMILVGVASPKTHLLRMACTNLIQLVKIQHRISKHVLFTAFSRGTSSWIDRRNVWRQSIV